MSATVKLILELNSAEEINASIRQVKFKPQTISSVNSLCLFHDTVTNWGIPNRIIITNNSSLERRQQMTTKREYLKSQGITVGARGRFSGAAKVAIEEALKKGITFTAEKPQPKRAAK